MGKITERLGSSQEESPLMETKGSMLTISWSIYNLIVVAQRPNWCRQMSSRTRTILNHPVTLQMLSVALHIWHAVEQWYLPESVSGKIRLSLNMWNGFNAIFSDEDLQLKFFSYLTSRNNKEIARTLVCHLQAQVIYIFQPNLHKMVGNNLSLAFGNRTYLIGEVPHKIWRVSRKRLSYLYSLV